jgi:hypothetical protein
MYIYCIPEHYGVLLRIIERNIKNDYFKAAFR